MYYLFIGIILGSYLGKHRVNQNYKYYDAIILSQQIKQIKKIGRRSPEHVLGVRFLP